MIWIYTKNKTTFFFFFFLCLEPDSQEWKLLVVLQLMGLVLPSQLDPKYEQGQAWPHMNRSQFLIPDLPKMWQQISPNSLCFKTWMGCITFSCHSVTTLPWSTTSMQCPWAKNLLQDFSCTRKWRKEGSLHMGWLLIWGKQFCLYPNDTIHWGLELALF